MSATATYTSEEMDLFDSLESSLDTGTLSSLSIADRDIRKKSLEKIAKNTIKSRTNKKTINIRIAEHDLSKIKALSLEQGVPYQTLIGSAIHKLASRELV